MREAPLYVQSFDLARWLLASLKGPSVLVETLQRDALALLEHVVLALKGSDRELHVERADERGALLRCRLMLARELALVDERQLLFLTKELDSIGRQLGGWMKRLEAPTMPARRR